jgi:SNF2 family DNA or RNA helicase
MATKKLVKQYMDFCNKNNIQIQTHQIYGVLWCIRKERSTTSCTKKGGVLADDMGMGKTIQMIATISLHFQKKTLIILPPILIQQWYSEILKFTGHSALIYHGKNKNKYRVDPSSMVITSYDTFLRSPELLEIVWDRTICDEAHRLRNPNTKIYKCIKQIKTNILWCITGTPIHNKIRDIMSLFSLFGGGKLVSKTIPPKDMILRRTKTNHIILPKKTELQEIIPWTNLREWKLAKDIHSSIGGFSSSDSFWKTKNMNELVTMIRAKQLCILPRLLQKPLQKIELDKPDDLFPVPEYFKETTLQNTSCKLNALIQHILSPSRIENGKIIFCHFQLEMTKIMELLREKRENDHFWIGNWKEYIHRNSEQRKQIPILILQIRAGCEGLNLQHEFSDVYFVSPNWNPTLEDQAIARCHRIGQQKEVSVYRFYMDTIILNADISMDLYILSKQNQKKEKIEEFLKLCE